jgi:hypothetical protein
MVVAVLLIAGVAQAQRPQNKVGEPHGGRKGSARPAGGAPLGVGAVVYDPGAPADFFLNGLGGNTAYVGNLFDTRNGLPLSPGSISQVSWFNGAAGSLTLVEIWVPGVGSGTQFSVTGGVSNTFNVLNTMYPMPSPRFVGMALRDAPFNSLGMRSASTNGQGFHAVQRDFGTVSNTLPGQNAMVRISGNIVIPVELTEFEVE